MIDVEQVPAQRPMPAGRRQALRDLLVEEARRSTPWWRRSRRAMTVGVGAMAIVLAGGAASAYVAFRPVTDTRSVECFAAADPDAAHSAPEVFVARSQRGDEQASSSIVPIHDPVQQCAELWERGVLQPDKEGIQEPAPVGSEPRPAPRLIACTLDRGVAGVFPGGPSTCERLGLPRATTR